MFCEIYSLKENWVPVQRYPFKRSGWGCAAAKAKEKHCLLALTTDNGSPPDRMMPGNYINIQQSIFKKAFSLYPFLPLKSVGEKSKKFWAPVKVLLIPGRGKLLKPELSFPSFQFIKYLLKHENLSELYKMQSQKEFYIYQVLSFNQSFKWESKSFEW